MAHSIETTLRHQYIERPRKVVSEYNFRLKGIETLIKIRIFEHVGKRDVFEFEQSHHISTPLQEGQEVATNPYSSYVAGALNTAVFAFTEGYRSAVLNGHVPSTTWLVRNESFGT